MAGVESPPHPPDRSAGPPEVSPRPHLRRRWALLALVALVAAGSAWGWRYHVTRPAYRVRRAREAMRAHDWERSAALANELEQAGQPDLAYLLRGESLFRQGYHADALEQLNRIQDQGTIRLEAAALSGRCLLQLGQARQAHGAFQFVIDQQPDHVDAHRGLAAIAYDQGNLEQAVHHLRTVAELDPSDGKPYRLIGLIHKDLRHFPDAEQAYDNALRRELPAADREAAYRELAECLLERNEYARALAALDRREEAADEGPPALALRAECLGGLGRVQQARTLLDGALRNHPEDPRLLALRGQVHLAEREPAQAARRLEQALRADPQNHRWRHKLAQAYVRLGRREDAAEQNRRVKEIEARLSLRTRLSREAMAQPWDAEVRTRLAEVCRQLGKYQDAAMWDRAAEACRAAPAGRRGAEK
jgi:tetratricopeptide (TPR) repeat protein